MNPKTTGNIILAAIVILVIGSIAYIEYTKPPGLNPSEVNSIGLTASSTGSASSTNASLPIVALQKIAAADRQAGDSAAVELVDPTGFINASSTFTLSSLIGHKVILLDFWTYSCINCVRTIPYLNAWYKKYKDYGFVIVGIHTRSSTLRRTTITS